jgi:general nucleoside transport system ATP-binding protein
MDANVAPRLELKSISKQFPGVLANDEVSFAVLPGEIHALLGENGAGKSTLVKIIYGVIQPDAGEIRWSGQLVAVHTPRFARKLGIGMVFQHFSLFEALTVLENIALGMDAKIPSRELETRIRAVMKQYGLTLDPHRIVSTLSVGERQRIEIVRALLLNPSLLIMDEPTSVLTPQEVEQLFIVLRQLASEGVSILYISHKLNEIKALCHTATILRAGKVVATCDPKHETSRSMAEKMIGGTLKDIVKPKGRTFGADMLVVRNLSMAAISQFGTALEDISFAVGAGEILGIAGVAGNGQNELLLALDGEVSTSPQAISIGSPRHRRSASVPMPWAALSPPGGGSSVFAPCPKSGTATPPWPTSRSATTACSPRATAWAWFPPVSSVRALPRPIPAR